MINQVKNLRSKSKIGIKYHEQMNERARDCFTNLQARIHKSLDTFAHQ